MIEGLKPYAEYKESGLAWLATIPGHWQTARNGNLFQQRNETQHPDLPILEVSLRTGVRVREFGASGRKQVMADASKYKRAARGDVAYNMMRMWQGAVGVAPIDGLVSPAYVVARPFPGTVARYYTSLFRNGVYMGEIDAASRGIVKDRNRLYWDQFKQMRSLTPPPDEQAAIVRFLDHANRKIDGFIRAKRKLIALLGEQKQAIIHRAVTGKEEVRMMKDESGTSSFVLQPSSLSKKPSGIPWLGDVPVHWDLRKLRRVCFYQEGPGLRTWQFTDSGIQVICVTNITASGVNLGAYGRYISNEEYQAKYRHFTVERGDLMLASSGNSWGKIAEYSGEGTVILNTSTIRLNAMRFGKITNEFLKLVLGSEYVRQQLQGLLTGSCQPNFGPSHLNRVLVTYPPDMETQLAVVSAVTTETAPLRTAIARTEREIALMQEYRTRLTADVVTGKLDVRPAAARLPDLNSEDSLSGDIDPVLEADDDSDLVSNSDGED